MLLMVSASAATSPFDLHGEVLLEIAVGDRGHDLDDAAHLLGKVGGHDVDVVGQVLPGAATPGTCAWPPSCPSVPTSRATRVTSPAKPLS